MTETLTAALEIVPQVVIAARIIVAATPTPKDNVYYEKIINFFKLVGLFSSKIK